MENIDRLIYIDDLTGLYNRRFLCSRLPEELHAAKMHNYNTWLFMMDIDNFKMINDTYGHLTGDDIIKEVSVIIKENTKSEDKKIRYAGDEFTIILPQIELKDVISVAERLLAKTRSHTFKDKRTGKELNVTMSLGIAGYPQDTLDATELINLADKALYISKDKGRDCVSLATEINPALFWKKDILNKFPCPVLIERKPELEKLRESLKKAIGGRGKLLLIGGDLGIGKSRLLTEFENLVASGKEAICLNARCEEKFLAQSYHATGQLLFKYFSELNELPQGLLNELNESETASLFNFMPVLNNIPGAPAVKNPAPEEGRHLSEAITKLLQNISRIKPLCLFFDNFHNIDKQTLDVLLPLSAESKEFPIMTIGAFSMSDLSTPDMSGAPLLEVINGDKFKDLCELMNLSSLTYSGMKEMVSTIFSSISVSAGLIDLICNITKGNPLFLQELLKFLIEKEYIYFEKGNWVEKIVSAGDLPVSIEDTIKKRIDDLSPETKEMIAKAAAIGEDFQVDLLQKIDSEDRGYILDLIEAAKKIGLIYESGSGGKDEFSFVTGEIRKILFNAIGNNQMKHFHSRIGEIKEKLYPDKISSIAGELYYNFKKAEDWVRAEQYAKVIREGKSEFYDQTIKYAQSLLQEIEEEKQAVPLSRKSWALIPEVIRHFYIAGINTVLYPPQSQMRLQPIEEMHKLLVQVLAETDLLIIVFVGDSLVVNNKKVGKESKLFFLEGFISLIKSSNIESISFEKDITKEELSKFVETLNNRENKEESLAALLKDSGVTHVEINEISYDVSKKKSKEKESLQEIMLMDYLLGKLPNNERAANLSPDPKHAEEITQALEKFGEQISKDTGRDKEAAKADLMAKSIQKIGNQISANDTQDWKKYKESLASAIMSMEPDLRAKILSSQLDAEAPAGEKKENKEVKANKENVDMIKELSMELPDEIIIDVISKQFLQKDNDVDKMRKLAQRFLSVPEKKERLAPVLKQKLNQLGATAEECDWMLGKDAWSGTSLDEKVNKISSLPAKNLFRSLPMMQVDALQKDLLFEGKDAQVETIIGKLFTVLIQEYPASKSSAKDFKGVLSVLIQYSPHKLLPNFIAKIISACQAKEEVFAGFFVPILNPQLDKLVDTLLVGGNCELIKGLMQTYTKDKKGLEAVLKTLDPVINKLERELARRIDDKLDWMVLADILILFGDRVTKLLIEDALFEKGVQSGKYFEAYLRRITISKILKRLPRETVMTFLKEKFSDSRLFIIKSLIELIQAADDEDLIGILEIPLKHPEPAIRKKTIFVLGRLKGKTSAALLGMALKDTDEDLRKFSLETLEVRQDEYAAQIVKDYKKG